MTIIKIEALENGGHDNQTNAGIRRPPEGWAELPASLGTPETLENFPFGDITVDDGGQWPVATSWTPLPVPAPEAEEAEDTDTAAALMEAVLDHEIRLSSLELGL